jgi:hypothetical protein
VEAAADSLLPHFEQNFASGRLAVPHEGQPGTSGAPQLSQKIPLSGTSDLQPGHCMTHLTVRHPQYIDISASRGGIARSPPWFGFPNSGTTIVTNINWNCLDAGDGSFVGHFLPRQMI